jgi:hypothetical protein
MNVVASKASSQRMVSIGFGAAALLSVLIAVYCWTFLSFDRLPSSVIQGAYSGYAGQSAELALAFGFLCFLSYPFAGRSLAVRGGWRLAFAVSYSWLVLSIVSYGFVFAARPGLLRWPATILFSLARYSAGRVSSPAPLFYHLDAIYAAIIIAASVTSWAMLRSFWRTAQLVSAALTLLPVMIFVFDRKEFGLHFASALVPLGLSWFTNEYLLFAGIGALALSTVFRVVSHRGPPFQRKGLG